MSGMLRCDTCREPVVEGRFYRQVTGWEKPRAQGGANQITLREETGRVRCDRCTDRVKLGGQLSWLDDLSGRSSGQ